MSKVSLFKQAEVCIKACTPSEKINLRDLIEDVFKLLNQQLKNHNIEVSKEMQEELFVMVTYC